MNIRAEIGIVVAASLSEGLLVRVTQTALQSEVKSGKFVLVLGAQYTYFSLITDMQLEVSTPDILKVPPLPGSLLHKMLLVKDIYATLSLKPMIMLDQKGKLSPVKMIPSHFSRVVH